ncbi:hypothetical protein AB4Y45_32230 [Paraburkholderia sp. EG287A]|uniref:hypothetical protein n=1 Tax=Paraburkholderia sp. EG287A TaxID=3237012 RepID=UPI0034D30DFC
MIQNARKVLPVIHLLDGKTAYEQATLAFGLGADGVFLISHGNQDQLVMQLAAAWKRRHPAWNVGWNLLGMSAPDSLFFAQRAGIDMVWADMPGVSSTGASGIGSSVAKALLQPNAPRFFGSVAFKYQAHEPDPAGAAVQALNHRMLPTTSGSGTGHAPDVEKARAMAAAVARGPLDGELAVASGMTPENVPVFLPFFTHYLVATGVSRDAHHFDEARLKQFIEKVHGYNPAD